MWKKLEFGIYEGKDYTSQMKRDNSYLLCRCYFGKLWRKWLLIHFSDNAVVQFHSIYGRGMLNSFSWRKRRIVSYFVLIGCICSDCFYSCRGIVMWSLEGGRGKLPPPWCSILFAINMMIFCELFYYVNEMYVIALSIFNNVKKI